MDGHFDCRKSKQTIVIWEIKYRAYTPEWNVWKSMKSGFISFMIDNLQKPKYVNVWKTEMEDSVDEGRSQNGSKKVSSHSNYQISYC